MFLKLVLFGRSVGTETSERVQRREEGNFCQRSHLDFLTRLNSPRRWLYLVIYRTEMMVIFIELATAALRLNIVTFRVDLLLEPSL